jgi:hypothetical protein
MHYSVRTIRTKRELHTCSLLHLLEHRFAICYDAAMTSKEGIPLQADMFTGDWKDNRTRRQRKADRESIQPQQQTMFSIGETYQLGTSYRPWLKAAPAGQLTLECEDIRTPEEIERDLIRQANEQTTNMFATNSLPQALATSESVITQSKVEMLSEIGYRKYLRQQMIRVRRYSATRGGQ